MVEMDTDGKLQSSQTHISSFRGQNRLRHGQKGSIQGRFDQNLPFLSLKTLTFVLSLTFVLKWRKPTKETWFKQLGLVLVDLGVRIVFIQGKKSQIRAVLTKSHPFSLKKKMKIPKDTVHNQLRKIIADLRVNKDLFLG